MKMLLKAYPAVFMPEEDGGYLIDFPDIQGAYTSIYEDAEIAFGLSMAEEALGGILAMIIEKNMLMPLPTPINELEAPEGGFVTLVKVDLEVYLRDSTPVKKTLTIPRWANELGKRLNVNFSKLLTSAIVAEHSNKK